MLYGSEACIIRKKVENKIMAVEIDYLHRASDLKI